MLLNKLRQKKNNQDFGKLGRLRKLNPTNNIPIKTRPVMVFLSILILITNYKLLFVFDSSFHKRHEQRMRVQYRTAVFRMKLSTDIPLQSRNLYDFH